MAEPMAIDTAPNTPAEDKPKGKDVAKKRFEVKKVCDGLVSVRRSHLSVERGRSLGMGYCR